MCIELCRQLDDNLNEIPIACASFKNYAEGVAEVKRMFMKRASIIMIEALYI